MKTTNEAFADEAGDVLRVSKDDRGWWIEVEERVAGEVVTTAAVGPLTRREARRARATLGPDSRFQRTGAAAFLAPPIVFLLGVDFPLVTVWAIVVLTWLAIYTVVEG